MLSLVARFTVVRLRTNYGSLAVASSSCEGYGRCTPPSKLLLPLARSTKTPQRWAEPPEPKRISLDVRDADIHNVLRLIADGHDDTRHSRGAHLPSLESLLAITEEAAVAAQVGSYIPKAAWLLGVLGFPFFKIWEPIIRYETRAFHTEARPERPVCVVTPEVAEWWGEMDEGFPFDEPQSIVAVFRANPSQNIARMGVTAYDFADYRSGQRTFDIVTQVALEEKQQNGDAAEQDCRIDEWERV